MWWCVVSWDAQDRANIWPTLPHPTDSPLKECPVSCLPCLLRQLRGWLPARTHTHLLLKWLMSALFLAALPCADWMRRSTSVR